MNPQQQFIEIVVLILMSVGLGCFVTTRVYAQERDRIFDGQTQLQSLINNDVQTQIKDINIDSKELRSQIQLMQSEIDTTRGLGIGISTAVVILQTLGLLKKRKET